MDAIRELGPNFNVEITHCIVIIILNRNKIGEAGGSPQTDLPEGVESSPIATPNADNAYTYAW